MVINGYKLLSELKSDNSGFAKWGFAEKDGIELFIKQFLSPVYPVDKSILSEEQVKRKIAICEQFENKKKRFYKKLNQCMTGNIITIFDFFRFESKYYVVTEKVENNSLTIKDISQLPMEKKLLIIRTILYNISSLHEKGIVHADIKPDNILIKPTINGFYTAKLIDFDSGFFEKDSSFTTNTEGDLVYLSPEIYMSMIDEDMSADRLTHKIDIFALGILFHQYLTGKTPEFDRSEYDYIFEAVLDNGKIFIDDSLDSRLQSMIRKMLSAEPSERPEAHQLFDIVSHNIKKQGKGIINNKKEKPALKTSMREPKAKVEKRTNSFLKQAGEIY